MSIVWLIAAVAALFAAFDLFSAVLSQTGQVEAARAAVDVGIAAVPYCLARGIQEFVRDLAPNKTLDVLNTHTKLLASLANSAPSAEHSPDPKPEQQMWRMCPSCRTPYGATETKCRGCGSALPPATS